MKYLNLGCGTHYSEKTEWTNLDFVSSGKGVVAHNLLKGIPFNDKSFDLVYHSHVLEHFSKEDGEKFVSECLRVLKPGGVLRIVIPDLECIVKEYLRTLEEGIKNPEDAVVKANYDWMMIEMFDQTTRNKSGGNMAEYLSRPTIKNEEYVVKRIGDEVRTIRKYFLSTPGNPQPDKMVNDRNDNSLKSRLKRYLLNRWHVDLNAHELGKFRLGGEIHQWMYDRYSLTHLLKSKNADGIQIRDAYTSYISDWSSYELDGEKPIVRKPDSLFIEAIKK